MEELFKTLGEVVHGVDQSSIGPWLWLCWFLAAIAYGIRHVARHMRHGRVKVGSETLGTRTGLDHSGASLWRSAWRAERRPSLSPFYGRPAALRALPYPVAVAYLWGLLHAPWITAAATLAVTAWAARRVVEWGLTYQHRRTLVRPMARALGVALGESPEVILSGTIVPRHYALDTAEVVIPLPDEHRPAHASEAARIVHERLGGEWRHVRSRQAPYLLTFRHKPSPPSYVAYEDVADLILSGTGEATGLWQPFMGLGTEKEAVSLNFDGHVVHLGISAGTGAGKSTLMRILAAGFAVRSKGTARMCYLDVKGDDEGMDLVPGMHVLNDIGDIHSLNGVYAMWDVIRWYTAELDARRKGLRGPKESWEPLVLFNDEQNAFAKFSKRAWELVKDKKDPAVPPVWQDMYLLGVMGRSFKIRMINAYQVMSAAATGGGNAQDGAELRRQFGNKMLARFDPSMWDNLVGTRPRGQSSDIPGRWLHVNNAGLARAVQLPQFEPEHVRDLCTYAGLTIPEKAVPGPSPRAVPHGGRAASPEIPNSWGDTGTGDTGPAGTELPDNVRPFRGRAENAPQQPSETRYTLEEACAEGIIPMGYEAAKKARTRATRADTDGTFPAGQKEGRSTKYTADELRDWYRDYEARA